MTPRIYDCFLFSDELDMLECRLRELDGKVHRHVLVESPVTHRGEPKPLHYAENAERFAPWAHRIIRVVAPLPDASDPWVRERAQRDAALDALDGADDSDLVLIADVDEIPSPLALSARPYTAAVLRMKMAMYAVDWLYPGYHCNTVLARLRECRKTGSLSAVKDRRREMPVIGDAGWHFTWLGGVEAQRAKLGVHCHLEMTGYEESLIRKGRCYREGIHHSGKTSMIPAEVDETWPEMIRKRDVPAEWFRPR